MSLSVKVNGTDYASDRVRMRDANEQGIQGLPASANGGGSQGGIVFDDPDGTFVHQGWQYVEVDESASTAAPRLCTGYLGDRTERRGKYKDGAGREVDATINDINVLLSLRLIDGADGKRPRETRAARVAWIMGSSYLSGLVADLGLMPSADGQVFEEGDFRGQYPSQVFDSISSGSIFFAYWDQTAMDVGVFFDLPTSTAFTSTLTISNDLSDCGPLDDPGTTCFPPYVDGEQRIDPSDVHSKHRLTWVGGVTVRNNTTTAATFFPSPLLTRGVQEDSSRIGRATTAVTYTDAQLLRASVERTTVTCTMRLPKTKIGLIDAGHRIFVKFTHLSGFETGAYTRVEEKSVVQTDGTREYYDLALVLSTSGLEGGRAGGGGTGGFPHPTGVLGIPNSYGRRNPSASCDWPFTPTAGNVLVLFMDKRAASIDTAPDTAGWTRQQDVTSGASGTGSGGAVFTKVSDGTETSVVFPGGLYPTNYFIFELAGVDIATVLSNKVNTGIATTAWTAGSLTPTAGRQAFIAGFMSGGNDFAPMSWTPGAGWTEYADLPATPNAPGATVVAQVTTASGSYNPAATCSDSRVFIGLSISLEVTAGSGDPPPPTTRFGPIIPVEPPDGATYTFTLPTGYEFADLSLQVFVNRLDQTAAVTTYDGAARTFTLAFAPWTGDLIEVYGLGR